MMSGWSKTQSSLWGSVLMLLLGVNVAAALPPTIVIDFETEDDFVTPLVNGQALSPAREFSRLLTINVSGPFALFGAAIFDSSFGGPNVAGPDPDLVVGLGNILILQSRHHPTQTTPGIFDTPDDEGDGGTLIFDFVHPMVPLSVDLIDLDAYGATRVTLFDGGGRTRVYDVPDNWTKDIHATGPNGYMTLDLTTLLDQPGEMVSGGPFVATATQDNGFDPSGVVRMTVMFRGSAGLDNLRFLVECVTDSDCDDGNRCTSDVCTSDLTCIHPPLCTSSGECDDGDPCTADVCLASGCCDHSVSVCSACCLSNGNCRDGITSTACLNLGGTYRNRGVRCLGDLDGNGLDDLCEVRVPTVSHWGLVITTLLLLVIGKLFFSRSGTPAPTDC